MIYLDEAQVRSGANAVEVALFQAAKETDSDSSSISGSFQLPRGPYGPHHFSSIVQDDWFE